MKGIVRVYPVTGKIKEGSLIQYDDKVETVIELYPGGVRTKSGTVDINSVKLVKYYVVNHRNMAELHYDNYSQVKSGQKVEVLLNTILAPGFIGDRVRIFKFDSHNIGLSIKPIYGVVNNIENRVYSIELANGQIISSKRHYFELVDRANYKKIGNLINNGL